MTLTVGRDDEGVYRFALDDEHGNEVLSGGEATPLDVALAVRKEIGGRAVRLEGEEADTMRQYDLGGRVI